MYHFLFVLRLSKAKGGISYKSVLNTSIYEPQSRFLFSNYIYTNSMSRLILSRQKACAYNWISIADFPVTALFVWRCLERETCTTRDWFLSVCFAWNGVLFSSACCILISERKAEQKVNLIYARVTPANGAGERSSLYSIAMQFLRTHRQFFKWHGTRDWRCMQ